MPKQSLDSLLDLSPDQMMRMNEEDLLNVVRRLNKNVSQRTRRLEKSGIADSSVSLRKFREEGGSNLRQLKGRSANGKLSRNQLLSIARRQQRFLSSKTGSVSGLRSSYREVKKRTGVSPLEMEEDERRHFWEVFNKINETAQLNGQKISSDDAIKIANKIVNGESHGATEEEQIQYELRQVEIQDYKEWLRENGAEDPFDSDESGDGDDYDVDSWPW